MYSLRRMHDICSLSVAALRCGVASCSEAAWGYAAVRIIGLVIETFIAESPETPLWRLWLWLWLWLWVWLWLWLWVWVWLWLWLLLLLLLLFAVAVAVVVVAVVVVGVGVLVVASTRKSPYRMWVVTQTGVTTHMEHLAGRNKMPRRRLWRLETDQGRALGTTHPGTNSLLRGGLRCIIFACCIKLHNLNMFCRDSILYSEPLELQHVVGATWML